ncbi:hypothetical protein [Mycobacteroides chelonae]|uniref:Uncharacterized protein n=1 Tax=Mycobacteroides chelonae TaxID=1774 RepID=A0A1S1LZT4_MYCCH|nr:hypothetical protein [Mycobacteroides chelonae]OHU76148.1 hypothetical protein BKG84_24990 [Mycobacteroides chelonae]
MTMQPDATLSALLAQEIQIQEAIAKQAARVVYDFLSQQGLHDLQTGTDRVIPAGHETDEQLVGAFSRLPHQVFSWDGGAINYHLPRAALGEYLGIKPTSAPGGARS